MQEQLSCTKNFTAYVVSIAQEDGLPNFRVDYLKLNCIFVRVSYHLQIMNISIDLLGLSQSVPMLDANNRHSRSRI